MAFELPLLSADGHLEVKPERWTPHVDPRYRDSAPRTVTLPDGGDAILVEGQAPRAIQFLDNRAGRDPETWQPFGLQVEETAGVGPAEQRIREQDADGIGAEVLFPNQDNGPNLWRTIEDDHAYRAMVRGYNDWLGQEYVPVDPDRLVGMGLIPATDLTDAIAELEHCAELGLRGVTLNAFPNGRSYPMPEDDAFWRAAQDMQMPLSSHPTFNRSGGAAAEPTFWYPGIDPEVLRKVGRGLVDWMANFGLRSALGMSQMICSGVFDRMPDLRMYFAETRVGWIPFWMETMDYWYHRHRHWAERLLDFTPLELANPSDYVRRNLYLSVQHVERFAVEVRDRMNVDHLMFATDFPHVECDWPNTAPFAEQLFAGVPDDEAYRIAAGNMIEYFHLAETEMAEKVRDVAAAGGPVATAVEAGAGA